MIGTENPWRIDRFVKKFTQYASCLLVIFIYLVSLVPLSRVTTRNESEGLREAVRTLQTLQAITSNSSPPFKKTLRYTIKTIQNMAGLQTFIFENHNPLESAPSILLTLTFRLPYLPASDYSLSSFINMSMFSFAEQFDLYLSLRLAPEPPPPVTA